jgi:hypothetical protein
MLIIRRIFRAKLRMLRLQFGQLAHEPVELLVADRRLARDEIEVIVSIDLVAQFRRAGDRVG